jgi:hypothetical protein
VSALRLTGLLASALPPVVYAKPSEIDRQYAKDVAIDELHRTLSEIVAGTPPSAGFQPIGESNPRARPGFHAARTPAWPSP